MSYPLPVIAVRFLKRKKSVINVPPSNKMAVTGCENFDTEFKTDNTPFMEFLHFRIYPCKYLSA